MASAGFIAQLVEQVHRNRKAMGSNAIQPWFFRSATALSATMIRKITSFFSSSHARNFSAFREV